MIPAETPDGDPGVPEQSPDVVGAGPGIPPCTEPAINAMTLSRKPCGVTISANTEGAAGTDSAPVLVLISTNRRQRPACWTANCCASAPPHEKPRTSTRS